ncbi:MAG: 50S ribosomal protein L10, partial [Dehalococcoidales bacterium]|nr:50S ribosomal protein L10 [Dehalococcoidales bacterium]
MATEKKQKLVEAIQDSLTRCSVGIVTDYRGMTVTEISVLRRKLREANIEYRVVKNSLAQIAARNAGKDELADTLIGPVALAFGFGEIPEAAKAVTDYIKSSKSILSIKGGFFEDQMLDAKGVEKLAKLPSKEVLIAQVIGG